MCPQEAELNRCFHSEGQSPRVHATSPALLAEPCRCALVLLGSVVLRDPSLSGTLRSLPRTGSAFLIVLLESDLLSTELKDRTRLHFRVKWFIPLHLLGKECHDIGS